MAHLVYWTFSEIPSEMVDILVKDLWKFERDIKSIDKNWTLIETTVA